MACFGLTLNACSLIPELPSFSKAPATGAVKRNGLGLPILTPEELTQLKTE